MVNLVPTCLSILSILADYIFMSKIAEALFEITLPRSSGDVFPRTDAGIVLAVADRYLCAQT